MMGDVSWPYLNGQTNLGMQEAFSKADVSTEAFETKRL